MSQVRFADGMFPNGVNGKTITLGAFGTLSLTRDITIQTMTFSGQKRNITVTRDATKGNFSLFTIAAAVDSASIEGLTLTGGGGGNVMGGAVQTAGNTGLLNCRIHDNTTGGNGAGVYSADGWLGLFDCEVFNNTSLGQGGGIALAAGSLQVEDCSISSNTAQNSGGGIALADGVTVAIVLRSSINGNKSNFGMGGGIFVEGGTQILTTLWVSLTTISGNSADENGGGIAVGADEERLVDVTLSDVGIIGTNRSKADGGGVYLGAGTLWTNNLLVTGNAANGQGGGLYLVLGTLWFDGPNAASIFLNTPNDVVWGI